MLCSISGSVPEEPVVSKVSGHLYEKRLVLKIIQETGRDPVTDEPLAAGDLVTLQVGKAINPRPTPATSIPGLLSLFQNEWDVTVLELHQLRTSLHKTRQELSHALYQHDAATRVIARLLQERDGYRAAAEAAAATRAAAPADANGKRGAEADGGEDGGDAKKAKGGVTARVVEALTAASDELSRGRKKRVVPPSTATPEEVGRLALAHTLPLHKTRKGGILAIDLAPGSGDLAATAGADGCVQVYDVAGARSVAELAGHSKRVNDVRFLGSADLLASASADRTVRLWRRGEAEGDYAAAATLADQAGEVVALVVHPSNDYLVAAAADGTWAFYDVAQALCLTKVADEGAAYSAAALHPDGLILSTGTEGAAVKIWETRTQKNVANFEGHTGRINSLSFSENGYYMASAATDGVRIWDLRKLKTIRTLNLFSEGTPTTAVAFDYSGLFLGVGGSDVRVVGAKQDWAELATLTGFPKKGVSSLRFGTDAKRLLVGASDHNLRVFDV
ncbi:PRP19 [Auxenochlorella protothecoides x Auxenochlorella symbiontica]